MSEQPVPHYPVEGFQITRTAFSVTMGAIMPGLAETRGPSSPHVVALFSMPLPVAKQVCMVLRRQLLDYESKFGVIPLPPEVFVGMGGVAPGDWPLPPQAMRE